MPSATHIKSIAYLQSHAAEISEDLALNGHPFFITQNGEASMVIEPKNGSWTRPNGPSWGCAG